MMRKDEVRGLDHWIGGSPVAPGDGAYFESLNPIDDSLYSRAAAGTPADVDRAVEAADTAYRRNRDLSAAAREGWMIKASALMERDASQFADTTSGERTSELQSLMRHSYAVICLKRKNIE